MFVDTMGFDTRDTVVLHAGLALSCVLVSLVFPVAGIAIALGVLAILPRGHRAEFSCVFWILFVLPLFGILPVLLILRRSGEFAFLGSAWLREFFAFFRPDPNPGWEDAGPGLSHLSWYLMIATSWLGSACASVAYWRLLCRRSSLTRLPN